MGGQSCLWGLQRAEPGAASSFSPDQSISPIAQDSDGDKSDDNLVVDEVKPWLPAGALLCSQLVQGSGCRVWGSLGCCAGAQCSGMLAQLGLVLSMAEGLCQLIPLPSSPTSAPLPQHPIWGGGHSPPAHLPQHSTRCLTLVLLSWCSSGGVFGDVPFVFPMEALGMDSTRSVLFFFLFFLFLPLLSLPKKTQKGTSAGSSAESGTLKTAQCCNCGDKNHSPN